jgi:hypothetical protein
VEILAQIFAFGEREVSQPAAKRTALLRRLGMDLLAQGAALGPRKPPHLSAAVLAIVHPAAKLLALFVAESFPQFAPPLLALLAHPGAILGLGIAPALTHAVANFAALVESVGGDLRERE